MAWNAVIYVKEVLMTACMPWLFGATVGALPLSFLSNWMGFGLAKAVSHEGGWQPVSIIPLDWPSEAVHGKDDASYYLFFVVRAALIFGLSWGSWAVVIIFCRGRKDCIFAVPLLIGLLMAGPQVVRMYLYGSGILLSNIVSEVLLFYTQYVVILLFGITSLVLASKTGHRRTAIWPASKVIFAQLFCYFAVSRVNGVANTTGRFVVHVACLWCLTMLRGAAMHVTFYSSMQIDGFNEDAIVFTNIMARARETRTWALFLAMNCSVVLSTLEAFTHMILYMCVWPAIGSVDLKSISKCPAE